MESTNLQTLEINAEVNNLPEVSDFVKKVMGECDCSKAMIGSIDIVVDEILGIGDRLKSFALIPVGYPSKNMARKDRYEEERIHYM